MDPEWGHLTIKLSGHPPFGAQIILNGHEWVALKVQAAGIGFTKEGNCFTRIADPAALAQVADTLSQPGTVGRLHQVCERWIYTACLCFGLDSDEPRAPWSLTSGRLCQVWEDEVASGVRSTSTDTLSDQPISEWPAGREADRTSAQRTAAVGLTDRRSLSERALIADHPLRLADDDGSDLGGPRRSVTGTAAVDCDLAGGYVSRRSRSSTWAGVAAA
jgi:hypothetical protein